MQVRRRMEYCCSPDSFRFLHKYSECQAQSERNYTEDQGCQSRYIDGEDMHGSKPDRSQPQCTPFSDMWLQSAQEQTPEPQFFHKAICESKYNEPWDIGDDRVEILARKRGKNEGSSS